MSIKYKPVLATGIVSERGSVDMNFQQKMGNNTTLKVGTVLEILDTTSEDNISKLVPEYHVMVVEDKNNSIYKNCMAVDTFGGIADYLQFKRRSSNNPKKTKANGSLRGQSGSIVLMLCLDGKADSAIIIGALAHPDKKNILTKEKEHHMEGEFNGLNFSIDKDGAMRIEFKSATDAEGKPQDEGAGGSTFSFEKDGSVELSDGNQEKIRIDKTAKTVNITAQSDISVNSQANVKVTATKNVNIKSTEELLIEATGNAILKTAKEMALEASDSFDIKGATVKIKGKSMATIDASQIQLKGSLIQVGSGGLPAVLLNTQVLSIGNLGAPAVGNMIGPFSSSVFIAS